MKVKKLSEDLPDFTQNEKQDWVDLYVDTCARCENDEESIKIAFKNRKKENCLFYKKGDVVVVGLGVAIELPYYHEAEIRPRSSTFGNTGLLLTNSVGTIDELYRGDGDEWCGKFYATRDGSIERFQRLLQFKVEKKMVTPSIEYVDSLGNNNRSGYGSTGK
jgi:dUTP pyrophosphatase